MADMMDSSGNRALERMMMDVPVQLDVVLGEARVPIDQLETMVEGDVLPLDRRHGEPVDLYVSDRLLARGRLVVADGQLGVTLTEIFDVRDDA